MNFAHFDYVINDFIFCLIIINTVSEILTGTLSTNIIWWVGLRSQIACDWFIYLCWRFVYMPAFQAIQWIYHVSNAVLWPTNMTDTKPVVSRTYVQRASGVGERTVGGGHGGVRRAGAQNAFRCRSGIREEPDLSRKQRPASTPHLRPRLISGGNNLVCIMKTLLSHVCSWTVLLLIRI